MAEPEEEAVVMNEGQEERIVVSFEKIAKGLTGIHGELKRAGKRYWPEPGPQREPISTHVLSEEEKRAEQRRKAESIPIEEWLTNLGEPNEDDGIFGERSRQWLKDHPPEKPKEAKVVDASTETPITGEEG